MSSSTFLPFWLAGLTLAMIPMLHWWLLRRSLAVSGRYSALVDRLRGVTRGKAEPAMSEEQLIAALRLMTAQEFGETALEFATPPEQAFGAHRAPSQAEPSSAHVLFLVGLVLGGGIAAWLVGTPSLSFGLRSTSFVKIFGDGEWTGGLVLFAGGLLVGLGTRMAGGCTSGHGLCGMSQLQKGSAVATACFFGAGILMALALEAIP